MVPFGVRGCACGSELLAQATWGHGSSRVVFPPGHLEPLAIRGFETAHGVGALALDMG